MNVERMRKYANPGQSRSIRVTWNRGDGEGPLSYLYARSYASDLPQAQHEPSTPTQTHERACTVSSGFRGVGEACPRHQCIMTGEHYVHTCSCGETYARW